MPTDDARLRAIIADMRQLDREQTAAAFKNHEWTDAEIRQVYEGSPEIDRLTGPPKTDPEIQKYLNHLID